MIKLSGVSVKIIPSMSNAKKLKGKKFNDMAAQIAAMSQHPAWLKGIEKSKTMDEEQIKNEFGLNDDE
jgi:hypothetical protein